MTTTHTRTKFAVAVGAAIAGAAASALLFLGAGTAQAIQDSEEALFDANMIPELSTVEILDPGSTVGVHDEENRSPMDPLVVPPGFNPPPGLATVQLGR